MTAFGEIRLVLAFGANVFLAVQAAVLVVSEARAEAIAGGSNTSAHQERNKPPSSSPKNLTVSGDLVYFSAADGETGRELWSVNAEGSCRLIRDFEPGPKGSDPDFLMSVGDGLIFFVAGTTPLGREPYVQGVGMEEPRLLGDLAPGTISSFPVPLASTDQYVLFHASPGPNTRLVYAAAYRGSPKPIPIPTSELFPLATLLANNVFLAVGTNKLWRSSGAFTGAEPILDMSAVSRFSMDNLVSIGRLCLFRAETPDTGVELWVTDGTVDGTHLLKDIFSGSASSEIGQVTVIGDAAWFHANDGLHGVELWHTDGTEVGTRLVKDICPGIGGSDPHYFAQAGGRTYFCANDGEHGIELWASDGTPDGTHMVIDLFPGGESAEPWSLTGFRGSLYFCANSPDFGEELFHTDGTARGTTVLVDIVPGPRSSGPGSLTNLTDKRLFFTCDDGIHGEELWGSDGSTAGTILVADIWKVADQTNPSSSPHDLAAFGGRLLFAANDLEHGDELWISDGSAGGTQLVRDIYPGAGDSVPKELVRIGPNVVFSANAPEYGRELWTTDGSEAGTVLLKDIRRGGENSNPRGLLVHDARVYFVADDGQGNSPMWSSDGTSEGTVPFENRQKALKQWKADAPFELRGAVYFYASDAAGRQSLLRIDSKDRVLTQLDAQPPRARAMPLSRTELGNASSSAKRDDELSATMVRLVHPPDDRDFGKSTIAVGKTTYFVAHTAATGAELWKTDWTPEGTTLVMDCFPGSASSSPELLAQNGSDLLFAADHPKHGRVLWLSDGTTEGTRVVIPVDSVGHIGDPVAVSEALYLGKETIVAAGSFAPRPADDRELVVLEQRSGNTVEKLHDVSAETTSPRVHNLARVDSTVFFVADDGVSGEELWKFDFNANKVALVRDILPYRPAPIAGK